ncbi:MAG TPA: hypothetical protein VFI23_04175 [Rhizomicrobium sp.]|nr:hypothetical protein [Rhizomicrobium sp.]
MQLKPSLALVFLIAWPLPSFAAQEKTYEGIYRFGPEEETISPCGTGGKEWWVMTSDENWHALRDASTKFRANIDSGIFVKVTGFYDGPATEERSGTFSTQYEGVFEITKIITARKRTHQDCK